jgi:hypothetical protein
MSDRRSFWSSVPGLVTGLAGLLTGIVGLVTVLIQLGVLGGKDKASSSGSPPTTVSTTTVTVAPGQTNSTTVLGGVAGSTPTTERGRFTVSPTLLTLQSSDRQKPLTVKNASTATSITVLAPDFDGADKAAFKADAGCTNALLQPGASCTLNVLFTPTGILRSYSANVVVKASGADSTSVPIEVKAGL